MHAILLRLSERARSMRATLSRWPRWILWSALAAVLVIIGAGSVVIVNVRKAQASAVQQPVLQTAVARQGDLVVRASGTGTLVPAAEVNIGFHASGTLTNVYVKVGDQVKAGDLLAQLDDTTQQIQLAQANQNLLELTSASAVAAAQQTVAQDQQTLYNAQVSLNNLLYASTNQAAIENAQASLVLAQDQLAHAQDKYSQVSGDPTTNAAKADAYQQLYSAQLAYNSAAVTYNLLTGKPNQWQVDMKKAAVALDKAKLAEDQTLLTALTGGSVPKDATGAGYAQLQQAKLNLQTAQDNLNATRLVAPISGTVMAISNQVGETVGSGTFITIADLSQAVVQIYMDPNDWSNVKVGYEADVTFDALPNQVFVGKVVQVSPQLVTIQGNSVVQGLAQLSQTQSASNATDPIQLPLGVSASVDVIAAQARNAVLVPVEALHQLSPGNYAVFVMVNGKPTLRMVQVGLQDPTYAEIKSGLKAGEVVSTGIQATTNGSQAVTP